jgi:hypothetical protein
MKPFPQHSKVEHVIFPLVETMTSNCRFSSIEIVPPMGVKAAPPKRKGISLIDPHVPAKEPFTVHLGWHYSLAANELEGVFFFCAGITDSSKELV